MFCINSGLFSGCFFLEKKQMQTKKKTKNNNHKNGCTPFIIQQSDTQASSISHCVCECVRHVCGRVVLRAWVSQSLSSSKEGFEDCWGGGAETKTPTAGHTLAGLHWLTPAPRLDQFQIPVFVPDLNQKK